MMTAPSLRPLASMARAPGGAVAGHERRRDAGKQQRLIAEAAGGVGPSSTQAGPASLPP